MSTYRTHAMQTNVHTILQGLLWRDDFLIIIIIIILYYIVNTLLYG